jgi:hypothetical protein
VLFLGTVLVPYRRGDAWAFWVLLAGVLAFAMISLARTLLLGTWLGVGAALVQAGIALAALVLGRFETKPQLSAAAPPSPPASAPR